MSKKHAATRRLKLAVFKLASCDGCQLSLLDLEAELLALANRVEIAHFLEFSSVTRRGPFAITLVEGSVATPRALATIRRLRRNSRYLVTIGACACSGGIQALRNFAAAGAFAGMVYPDPSYIASLATSTAVAAHVPVDYELNGCPIDKEQLRAVLTALLAGQVPRLPQGSVCTECKLRGHPCIAVTQGVPCLGGVTRSGCGAICPGFKRGCYGCFGPKERANVLALKDDWVAKGMTRDAADELFRGIHAWAAPFRPKEEART